MKLLLFVILLATGLHAQTVSVHPNPFRSRTVVTFTLAQNDTVSASVSDITGNAIVPLYLNKPFLAGTYQDSLNLITHPDGVYYFVFGTKSGFKTTIKLVKSLDTETAEIMNEPSIRIYPNPVSDQLTIRNSNGSTLAITLTNTLGEVLLSKLLVGTDGHLDLSDFPSGVYFLRSESDDQSQVIRIVKVN